MYLGPVWIQRSPQVVVWDTQGLSIEPLVEVVENASDMDGTWVVAEEWLPHLVEAWVSGPHWTNYY